MNQVLALAVAFLAVLAIYVWIKALRS